MYQIHLIHSGRFIHGKVSWKITEPSRECTSLLVALGLPSAAGNKWETIKFSRREIAIYPQVHSYYVSRITVSILGGLKCPAEAGDYISS